MKTVAHAILSPCGLYLYMYGCGYTYWVTLKSIQLRNATTLLLLIIIRRTVYIYYAPNDALSADKIHFTLKKEKDRLHTTH